MSTQSKTMPKLDLNIYVRVVAAVFMVSSATAFTFAVTRLMHEQVFYEVPLTGTELAIHYFVSCLILVTSAISFLNSCVVINRPSEKNTGRNITVWLLLDSLFETSRVVYIFVCEIVLRSRGSIQLYELLISGAQYLVDSFFYCQMILRH